MKTINYRNITLIAALSAAMFVSCQPDEFEGGNGLSAEGLTASFTVTPVEGKFNTYALKANTENAIAVRWDKSGSGTTSLGNAMDTVYYPDAGTYPVTLEVVGIGGVKSAATQTIDVETSDPVAGNLVVNGNFEDESDESWKINQISAGVTMTIADGKAHATGGEWGHAAIWQAIEVEAGKTYKVDLKVSGSGATETWFEVYVGKLQPQNGVDYSDGGIKIALNTWNGCGNSAFNGKLNDLSCAGTGNSVTFDESGTVYLLIKTGGANLGEEGITIDDVEFRGSADE